MRGKVSAIGRANSPAGAALGFAGDAFILVGLREKIACAQVTVHRHSADPKRVRYPALREPVAGKLQHGFLAISRVTVDCPNPCPRATRWQTVGRTAVDGFPNGFPIVRLGCLERLQKHPTKAVVLRYPVQGVG
jgi:hypothetical protein